MKEAYVLYIYDYTEIYKVVGVFTKVKKLYKIFRDIREHSDFDENDFLAMKVGDSIETQYYEGLSVKVEKFLLNV